MIARPAARPPADFEGEHPAGHAGPELARRDVVLGMARPGRDRGRAARRPDARATPPVPRPSRRAARPGWRGSGCRAGRGRHREGRGSRRCRSGLARPRGSAPWTGGDPGDDVAVTAEELRRRLDDEVRAQLERPADVRRRERVVDEVRRAVPMGEVGERGVVGDEGRRVGDGLGVERPGSAPRRARRPTASRSVVSTKSTLTPNPPNVPQQLRPGRAVDRGRGDDPVAGRAAATASAAWMAPMPEARAQPASPPASSA